MRGSGGSIASKVPWLALPVALVATPASAQSGDTVLAEALFQQGRAMLQEGKVAEACPKLAESHRLDPATGTLFALALCHEQEGKLASAWAEFTDAEGRARSEGRKDREELARERASALAQRLSTLTVEVSPEALAVADLEIRLDDRPLGRAAWNVAVPVDGGEHRVEARAPGRAAWSASVVVKTERDAARLRVPALDPAPSTPAVSPGPPAPATVPAASAAPSPATPPAVPPAPSARDESSPPWGTMEWAGLLTAGAGVVALGAGSYFLLTALDKNASADCDERNLCESEADVRTRSDAVSDANLATILGIGGAALAGVGATLFVIGRASGGGPPAAAASVSLGSDGARLRIEGTF